MTSSDLKEQMVRHVHGASFITLTQLTVFMGYSKNSTKEVKSKYLAGLEKVGSSYFIPDVVKNVMRQKAM